MMMVATENRWIRKITSIPMGGGPVIKRLKKEILFFYGVPLQKKILAILYRQKVMHIPLLMKMIKDGIMPAITKCFINSTILLK